MSCATCKGWDVGVRRWIWLGSIRSQVLVARVWLVERARKKT